MQLENTNWVIIKVIHKTRCFTVNFNRVLSPTICAHDIDFTRKRIRKKSTRKSLF